MRLERLVAKPGLDNLEGRLQPLLLEVLVESVHAGGLGLSNGVIVDGPYFLLSQLGKAGPDEVQAG